MNILAAIAVMGAAAWAQAPVQFEVASIRPSKPEANTPLTLGVQVDGAQLHANGLTLRDYLSWAYNLRASQIEGPDWIASERFSVDATMPPQPDGKAVDEKTLAAMLRALLEERFAMQTHRSSKEFAVYSLEQDDGGIQAKESLPDPDAGYFNLGGAGSNQGTTLNFGRGQSISVAQNQVVVTKLDMATVAENLARYLDRPIVDQTGLQSTYDFTIDLTPGDYQAMLVRAATSAGIPLPPQALRLLDMPFGDSLFEGFRKIGLKLEPKKLPLDVLVIDSISRTPAEN